MKKALSIFLSCSIALASIGTFGIDASATEEDSLDHTIDSDYSKSSYGSTDRQGVSTQNTSNFDALVAGIPSSLRGVNVFFNGERLDSSFPAVIYKTRTMVPLRAISENMGAKVDWLADEQAISIELGGKTILLQIDNTTVDIDGSKKGIAYNVPPKLMSAPGDPNATTMVPLRFISEELGAIVNWDAPSFTANIDYSPKTISPSDSLVDLKFEKQGGKDILTIYTEGDNAPEYIKKLLANPNRIVLDLKNTVLKTSDLNNLDSNTVSSVRTSQYYNSKEYSESELVSRVVLDIDPSLVDYSHSVAVDGGRIIVTVESNSLSLQPPSKPNTGDGASDHTSSDSRVSYTDYGITLDEMVQAQSQRLSLTDAYRSSPAYIFSDHVTTASDERVGRVAVESASVHEDASAMSFLYGSLKKDTPVTINKKVGDWYQITYSNWRNAKVEDIRYYIDPANFDLKGVGAFQFLDLSKPSKVSASDLNSNILRGKGILDKQGDTFIEAGNRHGVNEVYLVSHALLETGNGSSKLATGVLVDTVAGEKVEPRLVYNMFGIGAVDSAPLKGGSEKAYIEGWFTPEDSIIGGAKFIGEKYINRPGNRQNTLYKMRWNPDQRYIWHQYASDIGWAFKQTSNMKKLYDLCDNYELVYDIPSYR